MFGAGYSLFLLFLLTREWGQKPLRTAYGLIIPGALFMSVIAVALVSFTSLGAGPNAAIWSAAGVESSASINHQASSVELLKLMSLGALFITAVACGRDRTRTWLMLRAIAILSIPFDLLSLALHAFSPSTLIGYQITTGPERLAATLGSANVAGTLFGLLLLTVTAVLSQHWKEVSRRSQLPFRQLEHFLRRAPLELAALPLSGACLVLTASRTALAASAASLALFLIWEAFGGGLRVRRWFVPLAVSLGLAATAGVGGDLIANRYLEVNKELGSRLTIFQTHWRAVESSGWLGSGLGSFADLNRMLADRADSGDLLLIGAAHNVYLQWLEQVGLIGSVLMWGCLAWILVIIGLALFRKQRLSVVFRLSLASSVLVLSHGSTDFSLEVPSIAALWTVLLGLATGRAI